MKSTAESRRHRRPSIEIKLVLAGNLRSYRQRLGLSQENLAEVCGLHRTYIGSVERGERNVTLSTLEAIASALAVSVTILLTENGLVDHAESNHA